MLKLSELAQSLIKESGAKGVLTVCGYPACGKTSLSSEISKHITATILPAEGWIYPMSHRIANGLSGSNPKSYNVEECLKDIAEFLSGTPIQLREYSHILGDFDNAKAQIIERDRSKFLILDGTIFSLEAFATLSGSQYFLRPTSHETWLERTVARDINERSFRREDAWRKNEAKLLDMKILERAYSRRFVECDLSEDQFKYTL